MSRTSREVLPVTSTSICAGSLKVGDQRNNGFVGQIELEEGNPSNSNTWKSTIRNLFVTIKCVGHYLHSSLFNKALNHEPYRFNLNYARHTHTPTYALTFEETRTQKLNYTQPAMRDSEYAITIYTTLLDPDPMCLSHLLGPSRRRTHTRVRAGDLQALKAELPKCRILGMAGIRV